MKRRNVLKILAFSALMPRVPDLLGASSFLMAKTISSTKVASNNTGVLASIRLYNPTQWAHQTVVEVPAGHLATPGLINWRKVSLVCGGQNVPFSLREGRAHWRATLVPVIDPRAEDLLVFNIAVPPNTWLQVDVVNGQREEESALTREGNQIVVSYPNLRVVIDRLTGMLIQVEAFSTPLLAAPMSTSFFQVEEGVIEHSEITYETYSHPTVRIKKKLPEVSSPAKFVSSLSNAAMTELNFILEHERGPAMALTYRVHPGGPVEIWVDERPWEGKSPWLNNGAEHSLGLRGKEQRLPDFETQFPYYGFQDYVAVVKNTGVLHQAGGVEALELGEETINGRRWNRRLYIAGQDQLSQIDDMLQLVDKGLVVDVVPVFLRLNAQPIQVMYPNECAATAGALAQTFRRDGFQAEAGFNPTDHQNSAIVLKMIEQPEEAGLQGDGFAIRPLQGGSASITSGTRFGLTMGTLKLAEQIRSSGDVASVPLISSNPSVDLRAGAFGGWKHETDIPWGNYEEWTKVFDNLIASGMNIMVCTTGQWGDWKMPITYKYMSELRSDSPEAYDEVSGAKFSEFGSDRDFSLKLLNYLHARGVKVWLEQPMGAIPTTYRYKFPDAVLPGNPKVPLFLSTEYQQYLRAFFKEFLETYPIDGFMLLRDDNGGLDTSEEYRKYVAASRTKDPMWEQVLMLYTMLRSQGFQGDLAFYPYFDLYEPHLEPALPEDLFIVGHGSGFGTLTRSYKTLGPMGNTWLDNLYVGFRLPPTPTMKRLIADRGSLWLGGAFLGTELPWEAIGSFTWQPSETVNTLRYDWGSRAFGEKNALLFLRFSDAYEQLWSLMNGPLLPYTWLKMNSQLKGQVQQESTEKLKLYRQRLEDLFSAANNVNNKDWFAQVKLYGTFFKYCERRLELFEQLYKIALSRKDTAEASKPLPIEVRRRVTSLYSEMLGIAEIYANEVKKAPGGMMRATEPSALLYQEWDESGFGQRLDAMLEVPQFGGILTVSHEELRAGAPIRLTVELFNGGICPWLPSEGHKLEFDSAAQSLGLPVAWDLSGEWILPGDRRTINFSGVAPKEPSRTKIGIKFWSPSGPRSYPFIENEFLLKAE
jgi:hypothetical protein